jgi:isopentenyl diphosphate isomerase/L-lactate dehydrogenase-like FMN-dependent dehydrogenase
MSQHEGNIGEDRQREIYVSGAAGVEPDVPISFEALEEAALQVMDDAAADYVAGGAGGENTVGRNRRAFDRWRIVPRFFHDVGERDLSVEVCGQELPVPAMLAPIGIQSIAHEDGELATAEGAREAGMPVILSSVSSETMEDVAEELGDTPKWFQLYWSSERPIAESFVERAEDAGFDAIVVTVDTPVPGWKERDLQRGYVPQLDGEGVANYFTDSAFRELLDQPPEDNEFGAIQTFLDAFGDPTLTWDDLDWLREQTDLPIVVKGLLHPADARQAVEHGADGVIVSNHGGRQVDGALSALEALPAIAAELADTDADVLFDSGIRRGAEALTAIALGADAVCLGRPYIYGLAIDGANGVEAVCENFLADLDLTMGLTGRTAVSDVDRSLVVDERRLFRDPETLR